MNLLCVCTGNMCRSPMLEYLLKQELPKHGIDAVVTSAGTDTVDGSSATDHSITVMNEIGIDISAHRSRQMTHAIAEQNDVFVVMTTSFTVRRPVLATMMPPPFSQRKKSPPNWSFSTAFFPFRQTNSGKLRIPVPIRLRSLSRKASLPAASAKQSRQNFLCKRIFLPWTTR